MPPASLHPREAERIAALQSYSILDTACETAFDNIARLAVLLTGCPIAAVSLVDAERQWFKARLGLDMPSCPRDAAFCAHAILQQDPLIVEDAARDPRFCDSPLVLGEAQLRFYAGAPLITAGGLALGTLCVADRQPRDMSPQQREALAHLAGTVVTTLELRKAIRDAQDAALSDPLTELGNRRAMLGELSSVVTAPGNRVFSLIYLDLDGFKQINDQHGHAEGDRVLRRVAAALQAGLSQGELAFRLGGDEFALLVRGVGGAAMAKQCCTAIAETMVAEGWAVTASVGAITALAGLLTMDETMAAADDAMYRAKGAGKNRVHHQNLLDGEIRRVA
ncbi:sensor domain-containing diguanylate cyclase [Pseudoroseomonas globiformis]|uniref:Sensor domain-containing diguanylate cyclase n=1 Tax=Teichococcus globiformis TaxID=2307229 RepID=A0ABV7G4I9_9PROT